MSELQRLRDENEELRSELAEQAALKVLSDQCAALTESSLQSVTAELQRLREENAELRVREEQVAFLTDEVAELQRLREENAKLADAVIVASHEGWQAAHDKRECGHPRAFWQDANYPMSEECYDPETKTSTPPMQYRCLLCVLGAELRRREGGAKET